MVKFSRRVILLLLLVLVLLSLVVRYPLVQHERNQTDSYTMHLFSKSIVDEGYAKWTFSPLSYVGYYPLSYPSGVPFLLAEIAVITGADIELSILLCNLLLAVIFCFGMFGLSREFLSKPEYALLATFFAVMGARFVDTSYWDGGARAPMVVLLTLAVFAAFRSSSTGQRKLILVACVLALGCFATHHMAILLVLFGVAYVLAAFQVQFLLPRFRAHKTRAAFAWNLIMLVAVIVTAFVLFKYFGNLALMNLRRSSLFDLEPAFLSVFLNMGVAYANQIGVVLLCALFAVPIILWRSYLSTERLFLITLPIAFIPMLGDPIYVSMLLSPFVACLGAVWISRAAKSSRKKAVATLLVSLFAATIFVPLWSTNKWNSMEYLSGDMVQVDSRVYSDATYLGVTYPGAFAMCNNMNTLWIQLAASSETRFPVGGIMGVIYGDITFADVKRNVTWSDKGFPANLYKWFEYNDGPNFEILVMGMFVYGIDFVESSGGSADSREYFASHSKVLVIMDNNLPYQYAGTYARQHSSLAVQLENAYWQSNQPNHGEIKDLSSYMIYASGRITVFALQIPL
jgi:hypothetical protein